MTEQALQPGVGGEAGPTVPKADVRTRPRGPLGRLARRPGAMVALGFLLLVALTAIFAPLIAPHDPVVQDLARSRQPPAFLDGGDTTYLFGTDEFGRDLLSRIIYGARISLFVGTVSATIAMLLGTTMGLIAGYFERRVGPTILRFADIQFSLPFYVIAIAVVALFGPSLRNLVILLSFWGWATYARTIAVTVSQLKRMEYVQASRLQWSSVARIMRVHLLPGVSSSVIVLWTTSVGGLILVESALSFIGLGVQVPDFSWGSMLGGAQTELQGAWWVAIVPGVFLTATIVAFYVLGDALRDILNQPVPKDH
ncbi:ABC transporter permease [Micromonospora profundi]|uniref:ABC transporter permease n=1 Tax=Micromonospora TaxID=1873 RepID=UPI0006AFD959|nr:ABC transporter permease [Micromonospora sp. NRRL B-16802]